MDEIIDVVISLLYTLKYGPIINKHRNYNKKINLYREISGEEANKYRNYVVNEIRSLKIKPYSFGVPTYAIFEKHSDITHVFVINELFQFMFRLENYSTVNSFYIKIDDTM